MKKLLILLLFVLNLFVFGQKEILISVMDAPPVFDKNLKDNGFIIEIVNAIFQEIDYKAEYEFLPYQRTIRHTLDGKVAGGILTEGFFSEEKREQLSFSECFFKLYTSLFYLKNRFPDGINLSSMEEKNSFSKYKVAAVNGVPEIEMLQSYGFQLDLGLRYESSFSKLTRNRVDFVAMLDEIGYQTLNNLGFSDDEIGTIPILEINFRLVSSKLYPNSEELIKDFNRGLEIAKEKGILEKISKEFNINLNI